MKEQDLRILSYDRRRKIVEFVNSRKSVTVEDLIRNFPVSRMTVIRDLEKLDAEGFLNRVRGGAVALSNIVTAPRASESEKKISDEQVRIGKEAVKRIRDGDFLIIESGSTCMALANQLHSRNNLKIVTASPHIGVRLAEIAEQFDRNFEIILSGGILNVYRHFLLGPIALAVFENIKVDTAFVSATAVDMEGGITADDLHESAVTKIILEKCAKKVIGLITSLKFGRTSFYKVGDIDLLDEIITDSGVGDETVRQLTKRGIRVTVA
ncbi:MAG: DeoR/GlpR transcriptional regulator [Spirochaetales bacterium]|nr:MAG: DeoR/GlpR transcriptional regulator [Spirochaetales bacterium]